MKVTVDELKDLLVRPGHVNEEAFKEVMTEAELEKRSVQNLLVEKGLIQDEQLGRLIADSKGIEFVNLKTQQVDERVLQEIPEPMARTQGVIAFAKDAQGIHVGMMNPNDLEVINMIGKHTGVKVITYLITDQDLYNALSKYRLNLKKELDGYLERWNDQSLSRDQRNQTTVRIVDMVMKFAYRSDSSDIHVEPQAGKTLVRFRIDGVMHDMLMLQKDLADYMLTRIKILSKMRIDEHHAAQDGKFKIAIDGEPLDVRVSIVPVTKGENVVMRLLSTKTTSYTLTNLGLSDKDFVTLNRIIKIPQGMVLVTGPTGSGKTTTIYAILKILNTRDVHISSIEDPVEYDIKGVSQIQVNPETNLTFAEGLRAIVRQDPDIIGVGEIRDQETANIAVNSAMTGHLVLSTLHANDAATTLLRLIDLGVKAFLVASTVNIIIAQRLVRKICTVCRMSYQLNDEEQSELKETLQTGGAFDEKLYNELKQIRLYKGAGCDVCEHTGYKGRIGVFELLEVSDAIKDLVMKKTSADEITTAGRKGGMKTMFEDGLVKVRMGMTTLEELVRVISQS